MIGDLPPSSQPPELLGEGAGVSVSSRLALTLLLVSVSVRAGAHDLWIVPGDFFPRAGAAVRVYVNNGDAFPRSDTLLGPHRVERVVFRTQEGTELLDDFQVDGKSLSLDVRAPRAGSAIVALSTLPRRVRLKADEFNTYLEERGLRKALEERREREELETAVVERYAKAAKTILQVETAEEVEQALWGRPAGLALEIVPRRDPAELRPGERFPVIVLSEGQPMGGLVVRAGRAGGERGELSVTTDEEGEASLLVPVAGRWYLETIYMQRLGDNEPGVDWQSFWTTLTFEVRP